MSTSVVNRHDAIEQIIYGENIRIKRLFFDIEEDAMVIMLNTEAVLKRNISRYKLLRGASVSDLENYEFIGGGTGVHWPALDEDLSLKGFLKEELSRLVGGSGTTQYAMAA